MVGDTCIQNKLSLRGGFKLSRVLTSFSLRRLLMKSALALPVETPSESRKKEQNINLCVFKISCHMGCASSCLVRMIDARQFCRTSVNGSFFFFLN